MTERSIRGWRTRGGAALLLGALGAASVVGVAPAGAALPPAQATTEFCANAPAANPFTDVTENAATIGCLAFTKITTGLAGGTTYGPGGNVTRGQMATFIARMIDLANELEIGDLPALAATGANAFTDDNGLAPHEANINRLAAAGVVAGVGGGRFAPNQAVTRAQMATFINNAQFFLSGKTARLTSAEDFFTDDEAQTAHEANINGLAGNGIVQGGPGGTAQTLYGPTLSVNRSQMASFIVRYAALLESKDLIKPAGTPPTNQTFVVTPTEELTTFVSTSAVDNTGRRTYTAKVTGTTVDIALFPSELLGNASGQVSFRDVDATASRADWTATTGRIELANNATTGDIDGYLDNVAVPAGGTVTFAIDSAGNDSVTPVVFTNVATNAAAPVLALDSAKKPTVGFGVGGRTNWVPTEAVNGASNQTVTSVNAAANYFTGTGGTATFFYDGNDAISLNAAPKTLAQFEALLTVGDVIAVAYDRDEPDQSVFNVTTDIVPAPTGLKVAMADLDADGVADDATLSWSAAAQADARYNVYIDTTANSTFGAGDTVVKEDLAATTFAVNNANGKTYRVGSEGGTSGARSTADPSIVATTPVDNPPAVRTNGALVDVNANGAAPNAGDVWVLHLTEAVTVAPNASFQLAGGALVENGANGNVFAFSATGNVLTVTLGGTVPSTTYPATITLVGGIRDADEGLTSLQFAADASLEDNGVEVLASTFAAADGLTAATVTFNEAASAAGAANEDNYTFTNVSGGAAVTLVSAVLEADGRTVTFTFSGALDSTDTLLIEQGGVEDTDSQGVPANITLTVT